MKAMFYDAFGKRPGIETLPDPTPTDDGVVIEVAATGVCRSDWHGWQGHDPDIRLPHVPGHELAGRIVAIGKGVRGFRIGQRVTVPFVSGCGHSPHDTWAWGSLISDLFCAQCAVYSHFVAATAEQMEM